MFQLTKCYSFSILENTAICFNIPSSFYWMFISTIHRGSLENVWTVQVRHLLALETPTGPLGKDTSSAADKRADC